MNTWYNGSIPPKPPKVAPNSTVHVVAVEVAVVVVAVVVVVVVGICSAAAAAAANAPAATATASASLTFACGRRVVMGGDGLGVTGSNRK